MPEEQKTILIVDDEETLTWSMSKNLSLNKSYKVICANSGEEALEILQKTGGVDLIVSDIKMQGKDGLQLLSEVKARYPKAGFIIMTAYGNNEKRQEALGKGAIRYLEKPFMMDQVKAVISEVLEEMGDLFRPLDEKLKQKVKDNATLKELLLEKSRQVPELINLHLAALDGESLFNVGNRSVQRDFKVVYAVKVLKRVQLLSEKLAAGQLREVVICSGNYNVVLRPLAEGLLLYMVFGREMVKGKAILIADRIERDINSLLA